MRLRKLPLNKKLRWRSRSGCGSSGSEPSAAVAMLDSTAECICGIDLEHRCTFCNPACLRTLGYERMDEVLGKNTHDLIHRTRADGTVLPAKECRVHRVARTGEGVHAEDEVFWRA